MQKLVSFSALVLLLAFFPAENLSASREDFWPGKDCTVGRNSDCVERGVDNGLICTEENTCECLAPYKFYYGSRGKCLLPFGAPCGSPPAAYGITPNGECRAAGATVTCKAGYEGDGDECVVSVLPCYVIEDCNESKFQVCNYKICGCRANSEVGSDGKCQLKITEDCTKERPFWEQDCLDFSECVNVAASGFPVQLKCACKHGLGANQEGHCIIPHGQECTRTDGASCDTARFQSCQEVAYSGEQTCRCDGEDVTTWYNKDYKTCQLLLGADCSGTGKPICTESPENFSSCQTSEDASVCTCGDGLVASNNLQKCYNPKNALCDGPGTNHASCNKDEFLDCLDSSDGIKRCECKSDDNDIVYDSGRESCSILAGAECTPGETQQPCVSNARCVATRPGQGVCECEDGFALDENWECSPSTASITK